MSLYEFVDELGRVIRSGRLRAVGGTVGDVPTQQADQSLSQSPGGGSQAVKIERFSVGFADFPDTSVNKTVYVPTVGEIVLMLSLDQLTADPFVWPDTVPSGLGIGQNISFDSPANGWVGGGSGFDPDDPTNFKGLNLKIDDVTWPSFNGLTPGIAIGTTDPVQAGFDPAGGPFTAPTAGHYDFAMLIAVAP